MPATGTSGSVAADVSKEAGRTKTAADRANSEAAKLHDVFSKAKPKVPDSYVPSLGTPGGDIQLQPGLFTGALIGPGVWPSESESELAQTKTKLQQLRDRHQDAADEARRLTDQVYSQHWTDGAGADAAYEHYSAEYKAHLAVVDVLDGVAKTNGRLGEWIRLAKRNIRDAHDQAHREIEDYLKAPGGTPTAVIGSVILPKYRTLIEGFSGQLKTAVGDETMSLSNEFGFPEAPPGSPGNQDKPDDRHAQDPTDGKTPGDVGDGKSPPADGYHRGDVVDSPGNVDPATPATGPGTGLPDPLGTGYGRAPTTNGAAGAPKPSMPSMPSAPSMGGGGGSGGGASSPLSSLGGGGGSGMGSMQGMGGGANGLSGAGSMSGPASGLQSPAANATPASLGSEFGRGVAAGRAAAGGTPAFGGAQSAPPQPPAGPLSAAPLGQTSAAAAAAPVTATTPPSSAPPAAGMGGGGMGGVPAGGLGSAGGGGGPSPQMTPYSSVLPQSPGGAAGTGPGPVGSVPGSAAAPSVGGAGAGAGPGFLPGVREVNTQRVGRDVSMTDLEAARAVVADLAAASSVVYPGLEWAIVVSRGASGLPEMWVTTNEGAGYIPVGVHIPRSMPLAAHFDPDFDARWFGWFNPAETVLRAVRSRGDAVSAIATTWAQDSDEVRAATPDVAIGVAPAGGPGEAEASTLTRGRSHRLETIAPSVFSGLQQSGSESAEAYARQLTQQVVFSGPEMSAAAMSVARAVIANQWPSEREWADLSAEYEMDRLMAGSQRPGLMGVEEPHQLAAYQRDFAHCRRLETLLCWQTGNPADVVYAAITAGVQAPALV